MWPVIAAIKPDDARWIFVSGAVLALLIIVGGLGVWYYRKRVLFSDDSSSQGPWTFEDLRRMRENGDLTEEEYQSLRAALIGAFSAKPREGSGDPQKTGQAPVGPDLDA